MIPTNSCKQSRGFFFKTSDVNKYNIKRIKNRKKEETNSALFEFKSNRYINGIEKALINSILETYQK
ncbi:hypothetical protein ACFSX9_13175 [Flavobacterium ardleyense]|uniref:Uncharacterized protein n=1 Tax=Flavobacterium ardleyense TaxID=2038737 RepID=A0ABW5ZBV4_9FLAO